MDRFEKCLEFVLLHEGGTNADPDDRGGLTKYGISQRQYPDLNIQNLTRDQALIIYRSDYWAFNSCYKMNPSLDLVLFDSSVNCGNSSSAKWLQKTLIKMGSNLEADGIIGDITLSSVENYNPRILADGIIAYRLKRYVHLVQRKPEQIKFINGWINRISDLLLQTTIYF